MHADKAAMYRNPGRRPLLVHMTPYDMGIYPQYMESPSKIGGGPADGLLYFDGSYKLSSSKKTEIREDKK